MKKSNQIENELASTNTRISELESELNQQTATFEATQAAFIGGKANLDALHAEQSKLTLLSQAIESLEATANELRMAFDELAAAEARQNLLESAKAAANEAEKLWSETLACRLALDTKIGEFAGKLVDKLFDFHEKRREYLRLRGQFEPNQTPGLSNDVVLLLEKNHLNFPAIQFGSAVLSAYQTVATEREKQEIAKSRANGEF